MSNSPYSVGLSTLVVDDDPTMVAIIVAVLHDMGLTSVETAANGTAALERLTADSIELLVCDLNMPGMDGIRLMSHIASFVVRPAIILISGEDQRVLDASQRFAEAKDLNVLGVLRKPVTFEALTELLQRYRPASRRVSPNPRPVLLDDDAIRFGLTSQALHLTYQPKVSLQHGTLDGVEALLRWHDPERGLIPTPEVIRAAENAGLIDALTLAVLAGVVRDRISLAREGIDINMAFNVSMYNLHNLAIVERMCDIITAAGYQPDQFTLEVTETHLMNDLAQVLEALIRSRLQGFRIAIDDYGTGAATMQFLMQLPSTELKIDRSFVAAGPRNEEGRILLQSAIDLGLQLGQVVTAEGVETEEEGRLARELGCHLGQGYLYGQPMEVDALIAWTSTHPVRPASAEQPR
ncbi:MAG TPA: EAL domain-containing response regulator [Rhodanobacter sp.]|jgi:EAL domain-containing protein (putative c-di-GMP-specific phosphodiesterase class I)/CheY-like chemotaxis protein|nr:EAL domain-containing response regulator [Rhodanobacter sp.]